VFTDEKYILLRVVFMCSGCIFLQSPVSLKVAVPNMSEKPEWRLKGQVLTLTLPLSDTVSVIKAKIHEETGMPPGKQKLQWEVCMCSIAACYIISGPHTTLSTGPENFGSFLNTDLVLDTY
jgi:hypothetical protein